MPHSILRRITRHAALLFLGMLGGMLSVLACEMPPPGPRDLRIPGYYSDKASSIIDKNLLQENLRASEIPNQFANRIAGWSDDFLRTGDPEVAQCTLEWLSAWARGGALLGSMKRVNNDQSQYVREWLLDAAAISYLKVRGHANQTQKVEIASWLRQLSRANFSYWDDLRHKRNNHFYWTGVGILATAIATDDESLWRIGRDIYARGAHDIESDGSLPLEMARRSRALHYHDYALAPLVMMAEIARLRGEDWYGENENAIHRLALRVSAGYANPAWFTERSGVEQEPPKVGGFTGWVEFYRKRVPDPSAFDALHAQGPFREPRLGGDLTLMAERGIQAGR